MKQYINKVKCSINTEKLFSDFDIINIKVLNEKYKFNLQKLLKDVSKDINAIFHLSGKEKYLLVTKNRVSAKMVETLLMENKQEIDFIAKKTEFVPDYILLNLIFLNEHKSILNQELIDSEFIYYVTTNKKEEAIGLQFKFTKDFVITSKIKTLTPYKLLSNSDKEKYYTFYIGQEAAFHIIADKNDYKEGSLFVLKGTKGHKNTLDSINFKNLDSSKLYLLGKYVYEPLKNNKYISDFKFKTLDLKLYENHKYYNHLKDFCEDFFKKNELTIILDKFVVVDEKLEHLKDLKIRYSDKADGKYNLVVLNSTKEGENSNSDLLYNNSKIDNISQGINAADIKNKSAFNNSLKELIVKRVLFDKNVNEIFDWKKYCNKTYSFYLTTRKKTEENDEYVYLYHKLVIDNNGLISFVKVNSLEPIDKYSLKIDEYDLGMVVDEDGNVIYFSNTDMFITMDYDIFNKEVQKSKERDRLTFRACDLNNILLYIKATSSDKKIIEQIDEIYKCNSWINEENTDFYKIIDIKQEGKKSYISGIPSSLKKELEKHFIDHFGVNLINHYKSSEFRNECYPSIMDISYNEKYITISPYAHTGINNLTNNIVLKEYDYEGNNIIEDIFPMFYVPFVRYNQLTILPFPFKLLREAIEIDEIINK